jgi:hypothetical protein
MQTEVMEMKSMRAMSGVRIMDRVRNEEVPRRFGIYLSIVERINRSVFRWHVHVEIMEE